MTLLTKWFEFIISAWNFDTDGTQTLITYRSFWFVKEFETTLN